MPSPCTPTASPTRTSRPFAGPAGPRTRSSRSRSAPRWAPGSPVWSVASPPCGEVRDETGEGAARAGDQASALSHHGLEDQDTAAGRHAHHDVPAGDLRPAVQRLDPGGPARAVALERLGAGALRRLHLALQRMRL